jgi:hypothetical protein
MVEGQKKSGIEERSLRFNRNKNAVGAVALIGVGLAMPVIAPIMNLIAGINILQSGAAQRVLNHTKQSRKFGTT